MNLFAHQVKYAKGYPDKGLLVHEGGTGKTVCAAVWLHDGRDTDALVVCPKKIIKKWKKTLKEWDTKATVLSKEEFKKHPKKKWSAKVIDEADEFASPLFVAKKRSALSLALYELTQEYPDMPTLLLTATPIRSNPWNLHTLLCFYGRYIEWKKWRERFFDLIYPDNYKYSYLDRPAYLPKENWRLLIRPILEKYSDIVLLKDCVDELPATIEEYVDVPTPKYVPGIGITTFFDEHRHEQMNKGKVILEYGKEYRKVLVVAYYTEQMDELEKILAKDKQVFKVYGHTKDQEDKLGEAQLADDCYLLVQASLGVGFDGDSFSCVVFASMSHAVRDFVQMKFRVRRIHNLHPVKYAFLFGGDCDRAVFGNVKKGKDFVPSEYRNYAA